MQLTSFNMGHTLAVSWITGEKIVVKYKYKAIPYLSKVLNMKIQM